MRPVSGTLAGFSAMVLIVAACGGGSDEAAEVTSPADQAAPVTEAPPLTEAPAVTEAPVTTEAAPVTEAPVTTEAAPVTEAPVTTEAAPVTEAPVTTEATPVTRLAPTLESGVLTVGRTVEVTPFAEADGSGDVVGFEPDLVNEMATRLGLAVTWIDADFEMLLDDLAASRFDMVASNVTLAPDRVGQFGFTVPYFWDPEAAAISEEFANIAFPIDPANQDLQVALNETFESMLTDGTYQSIYDIWFDTPEMSVLFEER